MTTLTQCQHSQQLCCNDVNNYADIVSGHCQHSQRLKGHCVPVVVSATAGTWCPRSQCVRLHLVCVSNNYFITCSRSQQLHQHGVSVINDCADTQFLTWTRLRRHFEKTFSQNLKEQSGKKRYLDVVTHAPNSNN